MAWHVNGIEGTENQVRRWLESYPTGFVPEGALADREREVFMAQA